MTRDHRKMNYDAYWPRVNEILEARDEAKASCEEIGRQYWEIAAARSVRRGAANSLRPPPWRSPSERGRET